MLLISAPALAWTAGYTGSYVTEFKGKTPAAVYKSVDDDGMVSYSSSWPTDTLSIEQITITPGPTEAVRQGNQERFQKIKQTMLELAEAREQRQAERDKREKERLERLALQRSVQPKVYERRVYVGWNPLWWTFPRAGHPGKSTHHKLHHPNHRTGRTPGVPLGPSRSF